MAIDFRSTPETEARESAAVRRVRVSRDMFAAMIQAGVIREGERVQLIDGELFQMAAMNDPHWTVLNHLLNLLPRTLPTGWSITCQSPIIVDEFGEPEPDIAVIRGTPRERKSKPKAADAALVIEVTDTTLGFDRGRKQIAYSEAGISEYWILNIIDRVVEVRTDPRPRSGDSRGTYATIHTYRGDEQVPLRLDGQAIADFPVTELMPV